MTTSISSEAQKKYLMGIRSMRFEENLLKSGLRRKKHETFLMYFYNFEYLYFVEFLTGK